MDRALKTFLVGLALLFGLVPLVTRAESPAIVISSPDEFIRIDDIVPILIRVDTHGRNLNALDVTLNFSTIGIEVVRIEKNLTNFPLWPDDPAWDNIHGRLHFSAGRPNGFVAAGVTVATVYVHPRVAGLWQLAVADTSRGYLNSGTGQAVVLQGQRLDLQVVDPLLEGERLSSPSHPSASTWYANSKVLLSWPVQSNEQYSFLWSSNPTAVPDDKPIETSGEFQLSGVADGIWWFTLTARGPDGIWGRVTRRAVLVDTTAPLAFTVSQLPSASVHGATVIAWNATDGASGIASTHLIIDGRDLGQVRSPFTVEPKWAGKLLTIRAVDAAGNHASANWRDPRSARTGDWQYIAIGAALLLLTGTLVLVHRRRGSYRL